MVEVNWNDPALKRWLDDITRKSTKANYKSAFKDYAEFTGMTATELIEEADKDNKLPVLERKDVLKHKLTSFNKWMVTEHKIMSRGKGEHEVKRKGLTQGSANMKTNSIRSFYSTFGITVKLRGRNKLKNGRVKNKRMKVKADKVRLLVQHARSIRDRAIILVNFQGGMDASTLCSLNYEDVTQAIETGEHPFKLELLRKKTDNEYYTFLGKDAVEALQAYVADKKARGFEMEAKEPLFTKETSGFGERITPNLIQNIMKEVAISSGLVKKNNGNTFNPLGSHALRESFSKIMMNSGVPKAIVDFWLGHTRSNLDTAYMTVDEKKAREMYAKREHLLNVNTTKEESEEFKRLQDELAVVKEGTRGVVNKTTKLENEVAELKEMLKFTFNIITNQREQLERTEAEEDFRKLQDWVNKTHPVPKKPKRE